jgi:hypothetical protein
MGNIPMSLLMNKIPISHPELLSLDISIAENQLKLLLDEGINILLAARIQFEIDFVRDATDPRELAEIPEVRLWFIRLDSKYPWLPLVIDRQTGELARYAAMLVPHEFKTQTGIQYNSEALEIWVMNKVFGGSDWLQEQGISDRTPVKFMAKSLGYELDQSLFDLL